MARELELMDRIRQLPRNLPKVRDNESSINFPDWVNGPTMCKTRTFSIVIPTTERFGSAAHIKRSGTKHGAIRIVQSFPNRPTEIVPRNGLPGLYTRWVKQ